MLATESTDGNYGVFCRSRGERGGEQIRNAVCKLWVKVKLVLSVKLSYITLFLGILRMEGLKLCPRDTNEIVEDCSTDS